MARFIAVSIPSSTDSYEPQGYAVIDTKPHNDRRPTWGSVWAMCSTMPAAEVICAALEITPPPEPNNEEPF